MNSWTQLKELTASDKASGDQFGISVAVDGDVAVAGASGWTFFSYRGSAYVFEKNAGGTENWGQVKELFASDGVDNDQFGLSVALSGDTLVVSAFASNSYQGAVYIFERNAGGVDNWGEVKKVVASDGAAGDYFGLSVALDGDTLVVGAVYGDSNNGAAYVFERNAGGAENWGQVKKLVASDGVSGDEYGVSVGVSGDLILVGAFIHQVGANFGQGEAYLYGRNAGGAENWGEFKKLTASDGVAGDNLGVGVAVSGDWAVAGAASRNGGFGAAYVFGKDVGGAGNWGEAKILTPFDGAPVDQFGYSLSISGSLLAVSSPKHSVSGTVSGATYLFGADEGGTGNWGLVKQLTPSDGNSGDRF